MLFGFLHCGQNFRVGNNSARPIRLGSRQTGILTRRRENGCVYWNRRENGGLWIISLEPYSETVLQSGIIYPVGWVSDGRYVYAVRSESGPGREIIRVQVASPNEFTSVATLPSEVYDASVSPDGHEIVVSIVESRSDVWLIENLDLSPR